MPSRLTALSRWEEDNFDGKKLQSRGSRSFYLALPSNPQSKAIGDNAVEAMYMHLQRMLVMPGAS